MSGCALLVLCVVLATLPAIGAPSIGVAKAVDTVTGNPDGTYTVTYKLVVANYGDVPLTAVSVEDDLATAFSNAGKFNVRHLESDAFTVNPAFNGTADVALLAATDTLAPGSNGRITLTVVVNPGGYAGPFHNSATASGTDPQDAAVHDVSQTGTDPDPDQNGDPTDNGEPSSVMLARTPQIGLAKNLASVTNNGDGSYTVVFELNVKNFGNVLLRNVQIAEDLSAAYAEPAICELIGVTSPDLTISESYDGDDQLDILDGTDTLGPGKTKTVTITLCLSPESGVSSYSNSTIASAESPAGNTTSDASQRGSDPDPDGDGNPLNNNQPTIVSFAEFEHGGTMVLTVSASDTAGISVEGISLTTFLSVEGFTGQLQTSFSNTGMDALSILASGTLGKVRLNSSATFDPTTISFISWQGGAAFSLLEISVTDILHLGVPQTASYNLLTLSGKANGVSVQASVRGGVCPVLFREANVCVSWQWPRCDATISACTLFTGVEGFRSATVSLTNLTLFEDIWGIKGTFNTTISYTPAEKVLTPVLRLETDWWICSEISLLTEIDVSGSPLLSIGSLRLHGVTGECTLGDVTFSFAESLAASQNSAVTGKADYFERFGLTGPLPSCCGSVGSFSVDAYFKGPPAPAGTLLGVGLLAGSFELRLLENFAFSFVLEYSPAVPHWEMLFSLKVLW